MPWLLAALALLALVAQAQEPPPRVFGRPRVFEYRALSWENADVEAVLREVTGRPLSSIEDMAREVVGAGDPLTDPRLARAVEARLTTKLNAAGAEGWEAYALRETQVSLAGELFPAPAVLLRRVRY